MADGKQNVTFGAFFKYAMMLLPGGILYVATIVPSKFGANWSILSLFTMQSLAFVYVVLLYVVYQRVLKKDLIQRRKTGKYVIRFIYGIRMAIKMGIVLYISAYAIRELMLKKYEIWAVAIPVLVCSVYMGSRGLIGSIRFAEVVFWFSTVLFLVVSFLTVANVDLSGLTDYMGMHREYSLGHTISRVMTRGGLLFIGYFMLEIVVIAYLRVKNRTRGMLILSVGVATLIGIVGSIIVTICLGMNALSSGSKNILYVVGAMELSESIKIRPLMLVCYLLVVLTVFTLSQITLCGFGAIDNSSAKHRTWLWKLLWMILASGVCLYMIYGLDGKDMYKLILGYLICVDIPLSLILPALFSMPKLSAWKYMSLFIFVICSLFLTSCSYVPIEDADYATVIIIERDRYALEKSLKYTFVLNRFQGGEDLKEEYTKKDNDIFACYSDSVDEAIKRYDSTHANSLDTSHVEYIVVQDRDILAELYSDLEKRFSTSYVAVIVEPDIFEKYKGEELKEYLDTHYEGECLATLKIKGRDSLEN